MIRGSRKTAPQTLMYDIGRDTEALEVQTWDSCRSTITQNNDGFDKQHSVSKKTTNKTHRTVSISSALKVILANSS